MQDKSRKESIQRASTELFDLVILGGGIHGASLARKAALSGLKTVLFEAKDFGFGISSRSSKMLHGGVRYLEQADFSLVRKALGERASIMRQAPHLTRAQPFLLPILPGIGRPAWQMRIGLFIYDFLAHELGPKSAKPFLKRLPKHRALSSKDKEWKILEDLGLEMNALLEYYDGQMDDTRIVIENIVAAAEAGACVLNYAPVTSFSLQAGSAETIWNLKAKNTLETSAPEIQARGRYVCNLAGPWLKEVHELSSSWPSEWPEPVYSRGTHLLFSAPWPTAGLILPQESGRYFIWPYFSENGPATLVGPTNVGVPKNEAIPEASEAEISELLGYLARDFPDANLNEKTLVRAFAGMRILAGKVGGSRNVSKVSRSDHILKEKGYSVLLGGKYTTSGNTADHLLSVCLEDLESNVSAAKNARSESVSSAKIDVLPGGVDWGVGLRAKVFSRLRDLGVAEARTEDSTERRILKHSIRAAIQRFGSRSLLILDECFFRAEEEKNFVEKLILAQARYAIYVEFARDRAGLESRFGWDDYPNISERYAYLLDEALKEYQSRLREE